MAKDQEKVEDQVDEAQVAEAPVAPEAPVEDVATEEVAPSAPASEEVAAPQEMMTVNLDTVVTINGASYGPGSATVPAVVGEDLERMNAAWLAYEVERNTRHQVSVNSGSINAGS